MKDRGDEEPKVEPKGDIWDLKAIDSQIEVLKGSLNSLKSALAEAQGSYCKGDVSCNTYSMLKSVCSAHIPVVENEIKLLNYMKQRILFGKPNPDYFEVNSYKGA